MHIWTLGREFTQKTRPGLIESIPSIGENNITQKAPLSLGQFTKKKKKSIIPITPGVASKCPSRLLPYALAQARSADVRYGRSYGRACGYFSTIDSISWPCVVIMYLLMSRNSQNTYIDIGNTAYIEHIGASWQRLSQASPECVCKWPSAGEINVILPNAGACRTCVTHRTESTVFFTDCLPHLLVPRAPCLIGFGHN